MSNNRNLTKKVITEILNGCGIKYSIVEESKEIYFNQAKNSYGSYARWASEYLLKISNYIKYSNHAKTNSETKISFDDILAASYISNNMIIINYFEELNDQEIIRLFYKDDGSYSDFYYKNADMRNRIFYVMNRNDRIIYLHNILAKKSYDTLSMISRDYHYAKYHKDGE